MFVDLIYEQHMENAYPGSNILVVTLTNEESKRVESQSEEETLREAMGALRDMFGPQVPDACDILVPKWWNNRFQRCSYSNYPMLASQLDFRGVKVLLLYVSYFSSHFGLAFKFKSLRSLDPILSRESTWARFHSN